MRDMHCHILPGVDDGAQSMEASLAMLEAAKAAGVTSMVCTPHVRSPYFKDLDVLWDAYRRFKEAAGGFPVAMGFEVNHTKLMELGLDEWAPYLGFEGTGEFLLELDTRCTAADFEDYERTIFALQGMGYDVIIAHPERYRAIQQPRRPPPQDGLQAPGLGRLHRRRPHGQREEARPEDVRPAALPLHRE